MFARGGVDGGAQGQAGSALGGNVMTTCFCLPYSRLVAPGAPCYRYLDRRPPPLLPSLPARQLPDGRAPSPSCPTQDLARVMWAMSQTGTFHKELLSRVTREYLPAHMALFERDELKMMIDACNKLGCTTQAVADAAALLQQRETALPESKFTFAAGTPFLSITATTVKALFINAPFCSMRSRWRASWRSSHCCLTSNEI